LTRRHPPPCDPAVCAAPRLCLDPARPRGQQPDPQQHHSPQPARQALDGPQPPLRVRPTRQAHRRVPCSADATEDTVTPHVAARNRARRSLTVVCPITDNAHLSADTLRVSEALADEGERRDGTGQGAGSSRQRQTAGPRPPPPAPT